MNGVQQLYSFQLSDTLPKYALDLEARLTKVTFSKTKMHKPLITF